VQVHYDEGIANHIGPEPCAVICEGGGEASAGEHAGQPLSRESGCVSGADAVQIAEGNTTGGATASISLARRGRRPWHVWTLFAREPGDLPLDPSLRSMARARIGKVRSRSR
jgi:hypothetical protein